MGYRKAKQQPWYHEPLPRCVTDTLKKEQCTYTAHYQDTEGKGIFLCRIHAYMADFPTKRITEHMIIVGGE